MAERLQALDAFAGAGGWSVACAQLGIDDLGIENEPIVVQTRAAAGFETLFNDVWEGVHERANFTMPIFLGSPPCQAFSVAGRGDGRTAMDDILRALEEQVYALGRAGMDAVRNKLGDKIALVLSPMSYISRDRPTFVALEQVPQVLPVWEAFKPHLEWMGYSVEVGVLSAEQYGVPQTRRRAILVARNDGGIARLPRPTHSKYYTRDPERLDKGVKPWVSMFEALENAQHEFLLSTYSTNGDYQNRGVRTIDQPAPTITSKANRMKWDGLESMSPEDASRLQTFPAAWGFKNRPALTVTGHGLVTRHPTGQKTAVMNALEAGTFTPRSPYDLESARKAGEQREDYLSLSSRYEPDAVNCSPLDNAILQTFPVGFPFQGTRTQKYLQIGNALPPLLAKAILEALLCSVLDSHDSDW